MTPPPEPPLFQIVLEAQASDEVKQHAREAQMAWHMLVEIVLEQYHLLCHVEQTALAQARASADACTKEQGGSAALH